MADELTAPVLRREIRRILKGEDLEKITPKIVRLRLEAKYTVDLVDRKQEISQICKQVIDTLSDSSEDEEEEVKEEEDEAKEEVKEEENDAKEEEDEVEEVKGEKKRRESSESADSSSVSGSDSDDDVKNKKVNGDSKLTNSSSSSTPAKKKQKTSSKKRSSYSSPAIADSDNEDAGDPEAPVTDEELARRLQEQERPIRKAARHLVGKGQSSRSSDKAPKEKKKSSGGGYTKEQRLSPELADLMGTDMMARHEVVRNMHRIIKERNLQDPRNKQYHLCDDDLLKIFGIKRVKTFGMMKYLNKHINQNDD